MMKNNTKIEYDVCTQRFLKTSFRTIFIILIFLLSLPTFAAKKDDKKEEVEEKEFYSKQVVSENINNGVKVSIVKSDKYGNNQDEFTSVDITVENLNMYADLDFTIEALNHDEFKIAGNNKENVSLSNGDTYNLSFDYSFNNPTRPYNEKDKDSKYKKDIYLHASGSEASNSTFENDAKYRRLKEENEKPYVKTEDTKSETSNNWFFIVAIIFIAFIVLVLIIFFIRKYIKSNDDFYSFLLIIGISIVLSFTSIFNENVYAYRQQTFSYNTEYSNVYVAEVYHQGRSYTFRFKVNYKFIGTEPIFSEDLDSDGDGLTDNKEVYFMCDRFNIDTDGDGISDYMEIYNIDTDPLKVDTDGNGKLDSDEDYDKDGLSNIYEISLGTSLDNEDTDGDGLKDGDEMLKYHLNPLVVDTDNDGVTDYEEVEIAKKLGISDISSINKNTKVSQELTNDNFDSRLYKDNVVKMGISSECFGLIENHITVDNSNNVALSNVDSIVGRVAYINSDYENVPLTVSFDISNYSVKREALKVATYEDGKIKMIDTNLNDNTISATVYNGYVFVLDIDRFIDNILAYKKDNWK